MVNVVDDTDASMTYIPSIVYRDPVVVAIGTEGTLPPMRVSQRHNLAK